jgi:hypothetical protein
MISFRIICLIKPDRISTMTTPEDPGLIDPETILGSGIFTVNRVRPIIDADGGVRLATCGCGCSGSVSVSNTRNFADDEPEVLVLQP